MNSKEALAIVEAVLNQNPLSQLQKTVFCHTWEDQSYIEIARRCGYELGYIKQTGSQLWQLLSRALNEKVTKHNVQTVLKHKIRTVHAASSPTPQASEFKPESWELHTETISARWIEPTEATPPPLTSLRSFSTPFLSPQSIAPQQQAPLHPTGTLSANSPLQSEGKLQSTVHCSVEASSSPPYENAFSEQPTAPQQQAPILSSPKCDWGDAVDVSAFYGRAAELAILEQWIVHDRCRFIGLFGMGGIGKTSLSVKLAKQLLDASPTPKHQPVAPFQYVIWRSLRNAPPLIDLLADLIQFLSEHLSDQPGIVLSETLDGRLKQLMPYLRQQRCLIILDNGETIMGAGNRNGGYLPGYEDYARLWQVIGEAEHQSTLVLTSREKPSDIAAKEGKSLPVRSLRLTGLPAEIGQILFHVKGEFVGTEAEWNTLVNHYAGNPLALKMVAPVIQDLFDGQLSSFLDCSQEGSLVFGDIQDLLAQQINRLSNLEQQVMYWLAIVRQPITLSQLRSHLTPIIPLNQLLEALSVLERCFLIDKTKPTLVEKNQIRFTLQPVVMEYLTEQLIDRVCQEIASAEANPKPASTLTPPYPNTPTPPLLHTHALLQAQAKDYVRETQVRLILKPIADRLINNRSLDELTNLFQEILIRLRKRSLQQMGYAAGNVINLLCQLGVDLTGWNFSGLTVWSAYLRGVNLRQVNFTGADLAKSVFTETFSQILSVAFSPDGKLLATGDVNHEIHIWQVADGKQLVSCKVDEGWVWSVAFSPDGRFLASSANRTVKLWDVQTGVCLQTFDGYTDRVFSVAFNPDGRLLATGSEDRLIRIWDLRTGTLLHKLEGHTHEVRSVCFSPIDDGLPILELGQHSVPASNRNETRQRRRPELQSSKSRILASGSFDGNVRLWNAITGQCLGVLQGHTDWVWSVAFSPDGQILASSSSDGSLRLWDVSRVSGGASKDKVSCLQRLMGHTQAVRSVAFHADGRTLSSGGDDRTLRLWDYRTGECLGILTGHNSWISAVAFSPDNHWLASGSEDQSVRLWDSRSRLCLKTLQGYSNGVWSVAFNPQGTLLASGSQDRTIRLWDCHSGRLLGSLQGHSSWVWSVAFSPMHPVLASGGEDRSVKLWDIHSQTLLQTFTEHQDAVLAVLFSPDGRTLYSGSLDGTIKFWDIQTGFCWQTLTGHTGGIWCLTASWDGQYLLSGSQDQTIKIWEASSGACLQTLTGQSGWIRSVASSPDRQTVVSGSADGVITVWDLTQGMALHTLTAHTGPVLSIVFHPDGKTFTSCGTDGQIKLWDASSYQCVQALAAHDRWVRFLCYSPDGQTLASCSQDETIKLWQLPAQSESTSKLAPAQTLRIPRPYEEMTIAHAASLTPAQVATLKMLGARE